MTKKARIREREVSSRPKQSVSKIAITFLIYGPLVGTILLWTMVTTFLHYFPSYLGRIDTFHDALYVLPWFLVYGIPTGLLPASLAAGLFVLRTEEKTWIGIGEAIGIAAIVAVCFYIGFKNVVQLRGEIVSLSMGLKRYHNDMVLFAAMFLTATTTTLFCRHILITWNALIPPTGKRAAFPLFNRFSK